MKAGRDLDYEVALKVMGYTFEGALGGVVRNERGVILPDLPAFSTNIRTAWALVERFCFMIHPTGHGPEGIPAGYWVGYPRDGMLGLVGDVDNETIAFSESAPHAICLAALKAVAAQESPV